MFDRFVILFVIYSFFGFVWESIYCTIKTNTWQERGFLHGPLCPIYGCGVVTMTIILNKFNDVLNENVSYYYLKLFLIAFFGSMILEYTTSFALEKIFHATWWDYSNVPFNINGRVSIPTAIGFGIAGIVVPKYIIPIIEKFVDKIPFQFIGGVSFALTVLLTVDFTTTPRTHVTLVM